MRTTCASFVVFAGATLAACSASSPGPSASPEAGADVTEETPNPFVGSWSCNYTTNSGYSGSTPFDFTANPDGTLSSTSMLEVTSCTLQWTVSGSTATAVTGQGCGLDAGGFTVTSYTFIVTGNTATFSATAIEHGQTIGADGGFVPIDIDGSLMGQCTKNGVDAGSGSGSGGGAYP
jgi:hypothetical protein